MCFAIDVQTASRSVRTMVMWPRQDRLNRANDDVELVKGLAPLMLHDDASRVGACPVPERSHRAALPQPSKICRVNGDRTRFPLEPRVSFRIGVAIVPCILEDRVQLGTFRQVRDSRSRWLDLAAEFFKLARQAIERRSDRVGGWDQWVL